MQIHAPTFENVCVFNDICSMTSKKYLFSALLKFLSVDDIEGLAEATRVYGNLSRDRSVRDFLVKQKGTLNTECDN